MIDKENEVYTRVREKVLAKFPKVSMDSSYQQKPSNFPHVSLYMSDASTPQETLDTSTLPKHINMTFEAQVYSNNASNKKQECKKIMEVIVDTMSEMNFRMIVLTPVPNLNDSSIYRLASRFEGMADDGGFYRR